jgi:hypothetical protein
MWLGLQPVARCECSMQSVLLGVLLFGADPAISTLLVF